MAAEPQVNGEAPSSAFLSHLTSYPLISDSISTFKTNPYGAKSLSLTSASLARLQPLLPYLAKPYSLVSPYVQRADSLGESTLSSLDARFPVVRKPTGELYNDGREFVLFPLRKGSEGREYVLGVFGAEKKRNEQDGVVGYGRAIVGTGVTVGSEAYRWASGYLLAGSKAQKENGAKAEK